MRERVFDRHQMGFRQATESKESMKLLLRYMTAKEADLDVVQDVCKPCMQLEWLKHILPMQQGIHHFWIVPQTCQAIDMCKAVSLNTGGAAASAVQQFDDATGICNWDSIRHVAEIHL